MDNLSSSCIFFQTSFEVAKQACENDVHVIGVSSMAAAHTQTVKDLLFDLKKLNAIDIKVVLGGIVPDSDHEDLINQGIKAIFGPGTTIYDCAEQILKIL